jgi:AraC-like DNA-binding protein
MAIHDWIELRRDADTGIETIRAHFAGHAYDPHWHDSYLIGVTESGVQQFSTRRQRNRSTPGTVFMLEPGEIHDGDAPEAGGFSYRMLYIDAGWLAGRLGRVPSFARTLVNDPPLAHATSLAFAALHGRESRIIRDGMLDALLETWPTASVGTVDTVAPGVAARARDCLHAHVADDIGMEGLAAAVGEDRFRLTRAFKAAFGMAPHAYLVQLRLSRARALLAQGNTPADVAAALGFADQSHLGRWFIRAYRLTPARYRRRCTNLPDS